MDDDSFIQTIYPNYGISKKINCGYGDANLLRAMGIARTKTTSLYSTCNEHSNENIREMAAWAYERLGSTRG